VQRHTPRLAKEDVSRVKKEKTESAGLKGIRRRLRTYQPSQHIKEKDSDDVQTAEASSIGERKPSQGEV